MLDSLNRRDFVRTVAALSGLTVVDRFQRNVLGADEIGDISKQRKWTNSAGKSVEGTLVGYCSDTVAIKFAEGPLKGQTGTLKLSTLSLQDQQLIRVVASLPSEEGVLTNSRDSTNAVRIARHYSFVTTAAFRSATEDIQQVRDAAKSCGAVVGALTNQGAFAAIVGTREDHTELLAKVPTLLKPIVPLGPPAGPNPLATRIFQTLYTKVGVNIGGLPFMDAVAAFNKLPLPKIVYSAQSNVADLKCPETLPMLNDRLYNTLNAMTSAVNLDWGISAKGDEIIVGTTADIRPLTFGWTYEVPAQFSGFGGAITGPVTKYVAFMRGPGKNVDVTFDPKNAAIQTITAHPIVHFTFARVLADMKQSMEMRAPGGRPRPSEKD